MNTDQLDELIRTELERVARGLADDVAQDTLDYDESLVTLDGVLTTLEYYSTRAQYDAFVSSLPDAVLDAYEADTEFTKIQHGVAVSTYADSDLAKNLRELGFQAYMGMAELGFIPLETVIQLAKLQLQSNGTNCS